MGYTTDFEGSFNITPNVLESHQNYINKFSETRRMKRNSNICETLSDDVRLSVGLSVGKFGEYFVGGTGYAGQGDDSSVLDYNNPPPSQPGLWCKWIVEDNQLIWNECEKFYDYVEWLKYLIEHFFKPWGYTLNGTVEYQGEDPGDFGKIVVENNVVKLSKGKEFMKTRNSFVSNSSSSSFIIYGKMVDEDDVKKYAEIMFGDDPEYFKLNKDELYEIAEFIDNKDPYIEVICDYECEEFYMGRSFNKIGDKETGEQFKKSVENQLKQVFGNVKCDTLDITIAS